MDYPIVLSDPPWSYWGQQDKWGAAAKFYSVIDEPDLVEIARPPLASPGVLFLWATSPKLGAAIKLIADWGLHYRGVAFVWCKTTQDGIPLKAQGVRPSITKPLTEFVLAASNVARGRPLKLHDEAICQTVFAAKREHSRKPDEVRERIDRLYPDQRKLEMFARSAYPGWDVHGDEVDKFSVRPIC